MPRYFLHLRSEAGFVLDPEGSELPDIDAARREALRAARDMLAEQLIEGLPLDGQSIEICDDKGALVAVVPFKDALATGS